MTKSMEELVFEKLIGEYDAKIAALEAQVWTHRTGFVRIWNELHGDKSWLDNPEVVAVSFRVVKANIDAPEAKAA